MEKWILPNFSVVAANLNNYFPTPNNQEYIYIWDSHFLSNTWKPDSNISEECRLTDAAILQITVDDWEHSLQLILLPTFQIKYTHSQSARTTNKHTESTYTL